MVFIHQSNNSSWFCCYNIPLFNMSSPWFICYLHRSYAALSVRRVIAKMMVRVLALVFLFLLKLRSPANKSVAEIICKRYGLEAAKWLHKFEKLDFKIWKNEANLQFCKAQRKEMFEMLSLTLKASIILFYNKYYSQIDGVAMGSLFSHQKRKVTHLFQSQLKISCSYDFYSYIQEQIVHVLVY